MGREYFLAYHSYIEAMEQLNDAERGRLFTACLEYSKTGAAQKLGGNERFVFPGMKSQIDRDREAYTQKCRKNQENGSKGGGVRKRPQAFAPQRPPNAPQGEGEGKGEDKGKGEGEGGHPQTPSSSAAVYLERVNASASQASLEELAAFERAMGREVCLRAMDIALDNKKPTWAYIRAILRRWSGEGVKCLADVETLEARHQRQAGKPQSGNVFLDMLHEEGGIDP